ncbi:conserved hypothetical protein [Ricinus communis]|uniref:Uncharacterized protein n=1 Tax=Ricinus communis TaxID=3988 RepID=B9RL37_RICCO|nr:conserved hypothetical protein [Ricinus communis]
MELMSKKCYKYYFDGSSNVNTGWMELFFMLIIFMLQPSLARYNMLLPPEQAEAMAIEEGIKLAIAMGGLLFCSS